MNQQRGWHHSKNESSAATPHCPPFPETSKFWPSFAANGQWTSSRLAVIQSFQSSVLGKNIRSSAHLEATQMSIVTQHDPTIGALNKIPRILGRSDPDNHRVANHRIVHGAVMAKRVWKLQDFVAHSGASGSSRARRMRFETIKKRPSLLFGTA